MNTLKLSALLLAMGVAQAAQEYAYHGCFINSRWDRRQTHDVPITMAGVVECRNLCANAEFTYFGFECPHDGGREVHCECSNGLEEDKRVPDQRCQEFNTNSGGHCVGPFVVSDETTGTYYMGAGSINSAYRTTVDQETEAQWTKKLTYVRQTCAEPTIRTEWDADTEEICKQECLAEPRCNAFFLILQPNISHGSRCLLYEKCDELRDTTYLGDTYVLQRASRCHGLKRAKCVHKSMEEFGCAWDTKRKMCLDRYILSAKGSVNCPHASEVVTTKEECFHAMREIEGGDYQKNRINQGNTQWTRGKVPSGCFKSVYDYYHFNAGRDTNTGSYSQSTHHRVCRMTASRCQGLKRAKCVNKRMEEFGCEWDSKRKMCLDKPEEEGCAYVVTWHVLDHAEGQTFTSMTAARAKYFELKGGRWAARLYTPQGEIELQYGSMSMHNWMMLDQWMEENACTAENPWTSVGAVDFNADGSIYVNAGSNYVETKRVYQRAVDVSVEMRQSDGHSEECGVIAVFPDTTARHSGYNAGLGWWADSFGAAVGGVSRQDTHGDNNGVTSSWHTLRINVQANGVVDFYLDGMLRHSVTDLQYTSGPIRLGNNCRGWTYRNFNVIEGEEPKFDIGSCDHLELTQDGNCVATKVYGNNHDCTITALGNFELVVLAWDVICYWDYLEFPNGDRFCGTVSPSGRSVGNGEKIKWITDKSITFDGWEICAGSRRRQEDEEELAEEIDLFPRRRQNASAPSRRIEGANSKQILEDAITSAVADLGEAKDLAALLQLEFAFDISPSELLADKAREALDNRDEPPPRNWRERMARRARDAAIERAITSMERALKRQEENVKDFLKGLTQEVQDFAEVEVGEWEEFFLENAPDLEEFMSSPVVEELLEDPLTVITKEYWAKHEDALRELLDDMEAEDFILEQLADAEEFLKRIAQDARDFVDESFGHLTDTVQTVLSVAQLFGIQHPALVTLENFLESPQEFMKERALELVDDVTGSEKGQAIVKFIRDGLNSLKPADGRRRKNCWGRGTRCYSLACINCCGGYFVPWYWFGGGQCL